MKNSVSLKHQISTLPVLLIFLILSGLIILHTYLRLYQFESRMQFTWDQVKNAWVMKDMIIDHKMPLLGMPAKLNSGIFIGPAYYYLLVPFFYVFNLDPIAGAVFAVFVSIISFLVLFGVTKNIFNDFTALFTVVLYVVSCYTTLTDPIAWPVIFIPIVSSLIFYFLIRIIKGEYKYLLLLASVLGFSFHIHFTAIFFPIIILSSSWMFIFDRKSWKFIALAIPLFAVWFIPQFIAWQSRSIIAGSNMIAYLSVYYHGFHLIRFFQLFHDAFIEFEPIIFFSFIKYAGPLLLLLYVLLMILNDRVYGKKIAFITILWFMIPWLIFTLYSGEISSYYFEITRPIVFIILGYILTEFVRINKKFGIDLTVILIFIYAFFNIKTSLIPKYDGYKKDKQAVFEAFQNGKQIEFSEGDPRSYLYYVYDKHKTKQK